MAAEKLPGLPVPQGVGEDQLARRQGQAREGQGWLGLDGAAHLHLLQGLEGALQLPGPSCSRDERVPKHSVWVQPGRAHL